MAEKPADFKYPILDLRREIKDLKSQISECEKQRENLRKKIGALEYASVISKSKKLGVGKLKNGIASASL